MIIIAGSLSFDPADREDVLASLAEVTEASRRDAGCLEYFWGEDLEAPNTFRFFECWESQELLDAHLAAAARGRLRRAQPAAHHRRDRELLRRLAYQAEHARDRLGTTRNQVAGCRSHCGAKKRGSDPLGTLAPFVCASCRWPSCIQYGRIAGAR